MMNVFRQIIFSVSAASCIISCSPIGGIPLQPVEISRYELAQANQLKDRFNAHALEYSNGSFNEELYKIGRELESQLPPNNISFSYSVLNTLHANAFALPDGAIYVTSGLLIQLDNPNDIAAALAHEIGHVISRHALKAERHEQEVRRRINRYRISGSISDEDKDLIELMSNMQFSREQELQADKIAAQILARAGFPNEQYPSTLAKIRNFQGDTPDEMLSTHPYVENRITFIKQLNLASGPRQLAISEYQAALTDRPIYRAYSKVVSDRNVVVFRNGGLALYFPDGFQVKNITIDSGKYVSGHREGEFRIYSGNNKDRRIKFAYQGYRVKPEALLVAGATIKAAPKLDPGKCAVFQSRQVDTHLIIFRETFSGSCSRAPAKPFHSIRIDKLEGDAIDRMFLLSLEYRDPATESPDAATDDLLANLFNGDLEAAMEWMNKTPTDHGRVKLLRRFNHSGED